MIRRLATRILTAGAIFAAAAGAHAAAQETFPERPWAEVMLVGVHHLDNPGQDSFNLEVDDVLTDSRQAEIAVFAARMNEWAPGMVMIEAGRSRQAEIDTLYADYRGGGLRDRRNEIYQFGFRVADLAGLDTVRAVDVRYRFQSDEHAALSLEGDDRLAALYSELTAYGEAGIAESQELMRSMSIGAFIHRANTPAELAANSDFYHRFLIRGWQGDNQGAAHTLGNWYTRNILIYQNILRDIEDRIAAEGPGDAPLRVVVFYGQGHIPILQDLIEDSPYLVNADAEAWLRPLAAD